MDKILSGLRPTGRMHIGNFFGAVENWVRLQDGNICFFEIADWHTLTTKPENSKNLRELIRETVIDWFACGIDPEKSCVFVQSDVKEHSELFLLFSMLVTVQRLQRNPTLKDMIKDLSIGENLSFGLLGYPVLQAADILIYRANKVPVGEDQLPHIELTREIARRFNFLYGETFPEPEAILTEAKRVPGLDGKRMSKSLGNTILISDSEKDVEKKVMSAFTDPLKIKKDDIGHPEGCVPFAYLKILNKEIYTKREIECKEGKIGCVQCKKEIASLLNKFLEPIRERREIVSKWDIEKILIKGKEKAREEARKTMEITREKMGLWSSK
uniref:Tryptophan--tRNA ligase n=1 Tax=candidate division WOR-3 bacterium TaxID=2052148 RepID=A0A7C4U862_UNCW3